jgi:dienelactone hydrolase
VGTLFHALDGTAHPGVILIGGSEGGLHEVDAALLAAHGFSVLALAYFGMPGVPPTIVDIPLEYFATGGRVPPDESVRGR